MVKQQKWYGRPKGDIGGAIEGVLSRFSNESRKSLKRPPPRQPNHKVTLVGYDAEKENRVLNEFVYLFLLGLFIWFCIWIWII